MTGCKLLCLWSLHRRLYAAVFASTSSPSVIPWPRVAADGTSHRRTPPALARLALRVPPNWRTLLCLPMRVPNWMARLTLAEARGRPSSTRHCRSTLLSPTPGPCRRSTSSSRRLERATRSRSSSKKGCRASLRSAQGRDGRDSGGCCLQRRWACVTKQQGPLFRLEIERCPAYTNYQTHLPWSAMRRSSRPRFRSQSLPRSSSSSSSSPCQPASRNRVRCRPCESKTKRLRENLGDISGPTNLWPSILLITSRSPYDQQTFPLMKSTHRSRRKLHRRRGPRGRLLRLTQSSAPARRRSRACRGSPGPRRAGAGRAPGPPARARLRC